jgi:hypothetical protein
LTCRFLSSSSATSPLPPSRASGRIPHALTRLACRFIRFVTFTPTVRPTCRLPTIARDATITAGQRAFGLEIGTRSRYITSQYALLIWNRYHYGANHFHTQSRRRRWQHPRVTTARPLHRRTEEDHTRAAETRA